MSGRNAWGVDALAGAMYFIVGRSTEGGVSPYHLSVAGITYRGAEPNWGKTEKVAINSGYSLGTMQVDLGQRGTWPIGATQNAPLEPGQTTYVDDLIEQASTYAREHHLNFTSDLKQLRGDLLTHGDGARRRSALKFIDPDTRDSINAWATSEGGQQWIHRNVDYPQVRNVTQAASEMLDAFGRNVSESHRLEAVAILVKTANQRPADLAAFREVLSRGGGYDEMLAKANDIARRHRGYDGPKAAASAERYLSAYSDPEKAVALDRAHSMVSGAGFNPIAAEANADFQEAMKAIGLTNRVHILHQGTHGDAVVLLQTNLAKLGITDAHGRALHADGAFGPSTREAVEAFQRTHGLASDGRVGAKTLQALQDAVRPPEASLADRGHPGHALFCQALEGVHLIDAKCGRTPDAWSNNLAGSLATAAHAQGLARIDHVVLGDNATRAFAVQGDPGSPFKRVASVDVLPAVTRPLEQSSIEFHALPAGAPPPLRETVSGVAPTGPALPELQR